MTRVMLIPLISCCLILAGALVFASSGKSLTGVASLTQLTPQQMEACGLSKLSDHELTELLSLVTFIEAPSYLEATAFRRLEKDGWRPVQVLGLIQLDEGPFPEFRLLVRDTYQVHTLDPHGRVEDLPPPGVHWGKNVIGSWELLSPDGTVSHLWAR